MSKETMEHLNTYTVIGGTDWRGNAWSYRANLQGAESNHYPGFIPVEDVRRRLFFWKAVRGTVQSVGMNESGVFTITDHDRVAMLRPPGVFGAADPGGIMGLFKQSYGDHDYDEWLIKGPASIISTSTDDLGITSAGLLAGGAQAWVEISVPDTIVTPEGVTFRPNLLATTSFDGTLATTFKRSFNYTVCDNTRAMVLAGEGEVFRVKHTRNSDLRKMDAMSALNMVHTMADEHTAEIATLCATTVTDRQWAKLMDELFPLTDENGEAKTGRGLTIASNKREEMNRLWNHDERVSPWKGTAFGAVQAVNTWAHHVQSFKGGDRAGRNMSMAVTGGFDKLDVATTETLSKVLAA